MASSVLPVFYFVLGNINFGENASGSFVILSDHLVINLVIFHSFKTIVLGASVGIHPTPIVLDTVYRSVHSNVTSTESTLATDSV